MAINIKSFDQLSDTLAKDSEWRKKELIDMQTIIELNGKPDYLLRAGFVMLCAHFEGSIRYVSNAYLAYISGLKLTTSQLNASFAAIKLKSHGNSVLQKDGEKAKTLAVKTLIEKYHSILNETFFLKLTDEGMPYVDDYEEAIKTDSNPSSVVLRQITAVLCLDYESLFLSREPFLDESLVARRHNVAHGKKYLVDYELYREAQKYVLEMLDKYSDAILAAAQSESYLAS